MDNSQHTPGPQCRCASSARGGQHYSWCPAYRAAIEKSFDYELTLAAFHRQIDIDASAAATGGAT